jgi:hypothetical protein
MVDLIEHLDDIYSTFINMKKVCSPSTKLLITSINPSWMLPLHLLEKMKLKMPEGPHNWLSLDDIGNLLMLADFNASESYHRIFGLVQILVANLLPARKTKNMSASIIIPSYNEEENILECIKRIGIKDKEIIVVDDGSSDKTSEMVEKYGNGVKLVSYKPNMGKGHAVKMGFDAATKDILVILDADMSVPPEELNRFIMPIEEGKADFVNGTRLIYPLEEAAMNDLHMIGNKIFGNFFSYIIGQRITDTLCGTKSFRREDYRKKIELRERSWPDFDMLFGAAKNGLKIVEMPVHYKKRVAGSSKMKTFRHGWLLIKMCIRGFIELKIKR